MTAASPYLFFQQLRWTLFRNGVRVLLNQSLHRVLTILLCSVVVWVAIFLISHQGLRQMQDRFRIQLDRAFMEFVLDCLFLALSFLLTFSTGIILYSSLFASAETNFLLTSPIPADQIFAYKFQGALAFSSWAFVLLGSPILIAYGLVIPGAPLYYHLALLLFFMGFILLPGSVGGLLCLVLVNVLPRQKKQIFLIAAALIALLVTAWIWRWYTRLAPLPFGTRDWFSTLLRDLSLISSGFMPSHWVTKGLQAAVLDEPERMLYYLALVWSNGLFFYLLTVTASRFLFRRGFNRMTSGGSLRKKYGGLWLDHALTRFFAFLDPQTRLLIIKDFRTFRRDPAQWAQITIFLILALFYFSNMRRFYEREIGRPFQNGISLLTLTATSFLLCAYTGRFIFPMLSLEGRKFWILGLLPLSRDRLILGKFAFSTSAAIIVTEIPVLFSDLMLSMPAEIFFVHLVTAMVLSCALSGLSVGLGACMPNFRENDPSKIAVGFGGTLNLVAGLLLLLLVIALMAVPSHLILAVLQNTSEPPVTLTFWRWPCFVLGILVGAAATVLPLRAGIRKLRQMEF